mgnify:CR=1 FL=1
MNTNIKNGFGRLAMEEALLSGFSDVAEFLAPICKMDEDKSYFSSTHLDEVTEDQEEEKIEE